MDVRYKTLSGMREFFKMVFSTDKDLNLIQENTALGHSKMGL